MLNFSLSPEQLEVQQKARAFALKEVLPVAWEYDQKNKTPIDILRKAFEAGIMNGDIPREYGGRGHGVIDSVIVTEEIAAACSGLATSIFANSLGMEPIMLSTNETLKKTYLSLFAKEFKIISFATSEPGMGSDVSGIRCQAREEGDGYVLNGTKYWITNGGLADYVSVFATVDKDAQHSGICAFLVDTKWEGVSIGKHIPKMGQRASNTCGLHFDNVRVPRANVIAPPGEGFVLAMRTFSRTRPVIGAFGLGAARSAMEFALQYAKQRRAFGTKIANFEAIQFKIAEMYQKIETARLCTLKAAWEADEGHDPTLPASISKIYATEVALEVVNEALQIFGGYGYTQFYPLEKLLRDVRLLRIYEGTSEIQRIVVAGHAMNGYKPVMPSLEDLPMFTDQGAETTADSDSISEKAWKCRICGYIHYEDDPPETCPYCFFPASAFKSIER